MFVMGINHDKKAVCYEILYRCICALFAHSMVNSEPDICHRVWLRSVFEGTYLVMLPAGERIRDALRKLSRQTTPDLRMRLLPLRNYSFGFVRFLPRYKHEHYQTMESLDGLVPAATLLQSYPLIIERSLDMYRGLLLSCLLPVLVLTVVALYCSLDFIFHHPLQNILYD